MSLWFFIWLIISVFLLGFLGWTVFIITKQKSVWKQFAAKHKLRFKANTFLDSPEMNGLIDTHAVSLFASEHQTADARYSRKMTALEIQLAASMPVEGGIASNGLVDIVQDIGFKEEFEPKHKLWKKSFIAKAESKAFLDAYFTKERLDALLSLMKVETFWVILIFRGDTTLLRIDTNDPLDSQKKLAQITSKMVKVAQILELKEGEERRLKAEAAKVPKKSVSIALDEEKIEDTGLQLEDDEDPDDEGDQDSSEDEKPETEKE